MDNVLDMENQLGYAGQCLNPGNRRPQAVLRAKAASAERVGGLDTIRFFCAFVVVLFHFGLVPRSAFGAEPHGLMLLIKGALGCVFDGPAAVIVFFVISGFCIHFPFRDRAPVDIRSYYSRRLIRIGLPALIAAYLWVLVGVRLEPEDAGIFWSVICEIEYYLLYPVLLRLRRRVGWCLLIAISQVLAYLLALSHLSDIERVVGGYPAFGWLNWVVGLPCWLCGCWLAENFVRFPVPSATLIWVIRSCVFVTSGGLQALRFHGGSVFLSNAFTLNLFAVIACSWLGLEIAYRRKTAAPAITEWAGKWSYSLYLMHPALPGLFALHSWFRPVLSSNWGSVVVILSSLPIAYGFYLVVEAPFHRLAIAVSRRVKSIVPAGALVTQDS